MRKGFTLIELVMVIVILGILAVFAIPKYFDLRNQARQSAEEGIVGAVRAGIMTYYVNQCAQGSCAYPTNLDSATDGSCTTDNPCFDNVLSQGGITSGGWSKSGTDYTGPTGATYTYNSTTGEFK